MAETAVKSVKRVDYKDAVSGDQLTIYMEEVMDAAYGCYVWPSALVMADFCWYHRNHFRDCTVLEIGAGARSHGRCNPPDTDQ
ncbi:hypothetical protein BCR43DRAFT_498698 [Syncephalastrum racemosum]|uniref:Uncharacterized protein n=1 Tax=Syncephalastrum racemosum TaxID=13706 RepID=A0A1X2H1F6_SYNRA|nr:hypothetical protein BCR43DRAFT_498698 [Syncephalastrum racemosum]